MMTFVLWLLAILTVFLCVIPMIRCLFKRISCAVKLHRICRRLGFTLQGTHAFWFLGSRSGKGCDCVIATPAHLFSIKLFGVMHRRRVLIFRESGEYFFRRFTSMLLFLLDAFDCSFRRLPDYDFSRGASLATGRIRYDILLLNPIPMEIRFQHRNGQEIITSPGDDLFGMELASLSHLMRSLENAARESA
ncbi:MAG: hypothetical protein E7316_01035 [Clostridiales bacterium]|nr:hypothetical protein [Clostridiales bacterium]